MVFNATFNNISVISWWSVLLLEETRVLGENHQPVTSHWQTLTHNVSSTPLHEQGYLPWNSYMIKFVIRLVLKSNQVDLLQIWIEISSIKKTCIYKQNRNIILYNNYVPIHTTTSVCNQCLSPLKLWVPTLFMERCTRYIMC
jgi:hypothetical protein